MTRAIPLAEALEDPGAAPAHGRDLVEWMGGRRAAVQALSGMSGPPRRSAYESAEAYRADSIRWRTASRRVQRWTTAAGERRGGQRVVLSEAQRERAREAAVDANYSRAVRRGLRARLRARVEVSTPNPRGRHDARVRDLPSGGPGVLLAPEVVDRILAEVERDEARAAGLFREAFFEAYGMPDDATFSEVLWLKLWPDGQAEPAA